MAYKESYNWAQKYKFTSSSVAGYNFDDLTDNIYIFNKVLLLPIICTRVM